MLPWIEIDMKKAFAEIMPGFSGENLPSIFRSPNTRIKVNGQPVVPQMIIPISGDDSKTGWAILVSSAVASLLSIFYKQSARTTRNLEVLAISIAGLLSLYVVFSAFTSVRYGLIIVLGGILIQIRGLRAEWKER